MDYYDIPGYKDLYVIDMSGNVLSLPRDKHTPRGGVFKSRLKVMKPYILTNGYLAVTLSKDKKQKVMLVHRIMSEVFLTKVPGKDFVNHRNGIKTCNYLFNLEWVTRSENMKHAFDNGLISRKRRRVKG